MITDYIVFGALLFFLQNGWRKGFFRTLLRPISLIAGCLIAFVHYQRTQNMAISLSIGVLSPFALRFLFAMLLELWNKATNEGAPPSILSKLFGGVLGVVWSGGYLAMTLILIGLLPFRFAWFEKVQDDVMASKSYTAVQQFTSNRIPAAASFDFDKITSLIENPTQFQKFQSTEEFETLANDDILRDILSDEETAEQLRNKDYGKLLTNPKIQAIMQNKELLEKMFTLNTKIMEEAFDDDLSNTTTDGWSE